MSIKDTVQRFEGDNIKRQSHGTGGYEKLPPFSYARDLRRRGEFLKSLAEGNVKVVEGKAAERIAQNVNGNSSVLMREGATR